jgi:hypothetical protein
MFVVSSTLPVDVQPADDPFFDAVPAAAQLITRSVSP